jgi:outer membrane protein TolC
MRIERPERRHRAAGPWRPGILGVLFLGAQLAVAGGPMSPEAVKECRWDGGTLLIDLPCALRLARENAFDILDQETNLRGSWRREKLAQQDFRVQVTPTLSASTSSVSSSSPALSPTPATETPSTETYRGSLRLSKLFELGTTVNVEPFYEFGGGSRASGVVASISQPLLRGIAPVYVLNVLDSATAQAKIAGWSQTQSCLATLVGVVDQLSSLGELQERHRLFSESLLSMETKLTITQARERAGLASSLDVLRAKIERTNLRDLVASVSEQLGDAADRLRFTLRLPAGLSIRGLIGPRDQPAVPDRGPETTGRFDVMIAAESLSEARRQVRITRHAILPDLSAAFTLGYTHNEVNAVLGTTIPSAVTWTLSLRSTGEIRRSAEKAAYQDALDRLEIAARALVQTQERARDEIRSLGRQLERLRKQEAIQREQIEQAASKLAIAEAKFRNGLASNFDFLESETELRNAQVALLSAQRDVVPALHRLLNGMGRYESWLKETHAVDCAAQTASR